MLCSRVGHAETETHHPPFQIWIATIMDLLKYLFEKPVLNEKLSRWLILLAKFDLKYVVRKTIKGSVVLDFYVESPIEGKTVKKIS